MAHLSIRERALDCVQAYNSRNHGALMQCYDVHAVNIQHPWRKAVHGIAAIRCPDEAHLQLLSRHLAQR